MLTYDEFRKNFVITYSVYKPDGFVDIACGVKNTK